SRLETDNAVIPLFMQWSDKTTVEVLASGAENDAPLSALLALHWRKYDTLMQAMLRCTSLESNQVRTRLLANYILLSKDFLSINHDSHSTATSAYA
ncbi:MAG: hypothetical protein SGPRY_012167, partial [Prymnesium sp.]